MRIKLDAVKEMTVTDGSFELACCLSQISYRFGSVHVVLYKGFSNILLGVKAR